MKRLLMLFLMLPGLALAQPVTRWHAVLVAGDPSLEVWDAAVESMATALERGGQMASVRRFSARRDRMQNGAEPATPEGVLRAIAEMRPGPGEACLVFLTMHGAPNQGLVFPLARQAMGPAPLDAALSRYPSLGALAGKVGLVRALRAPEGVPAEPMSSGQLTAYAGRYADPGQATTLELTESGLQRSVEVTPVSGSWEPTVVAPPPGPTPVTFLGPDSAVAGGMRMPFLRNESGDIGWLSDGLRLRPRTS